MPTDESILPSSRKIKFIAVSIPCLLVFYVLSIGPVAKLDECGWLDENGWLGKPESKILHVVYAPMSLLVKIPGMNRLLDDYLFGVWQLDSMTTR